MQNLICNAYAFIEFQKCFRTYVEKDEDDRDLKRLRADWIQVVGAYKVVSEYMDDDAIAQAQALVMGVY